MALSFNPDPVYGRVRFKPSLVRELPKNGDVPKSPVLPIGSLGAVGRHNSTHNALASYPAGAASRATDDRYRRFRRMLSAHERRRYRFVCSGLGRDKGRRAAVTNFVGQLGSFGG